MTFEKTVILSVILHAVILAAISFSLKKPYITLPPFEVNLVSTEAKNLSAPAPAAPEAPKAAPRPDNAKSRMAVQPEKTNRRDMQQEINDALARLRGSRSRNEEINNALARLRGSHSRDEEINNALAKLRGIARLKKELEINGQTKSPGQAGAASAGAADGNASLEAYANTVAALIR